MKNNSRVILIILLLAVIGLVPISVNVFGVGGDMGVLFWDVLGLIGYMGIQQFLGIGNSNGANFV